MTAVGKEIQSLLEVLLLDEYVVRIERGDCEYADTVVREDLGYAGQDTYQGEVQDSLDPERPPSVLPFDGVAWDTFRRAYERVLLIRSRYEGEFTVNVDECVVLHLTDRECTVDYLQFHGGHSPDTVLNIMVGLSLMDSSISFESWFYGICGYL